MDPTERTTQNGTGGNPAAGPDSLDFAVECARLLRADKCEHVVVLDVSDLSDVMDYVIIATGTSDRQMNSTLDDLEDLGDESCRAAYRTSKDDRSTWLLADFVDVVVHLFEPNTRAFYDLEMLWGDARRVSWRGAGEEDRGGDGASA